LWKWGEGLREVRRRSVAPVYGVIAVWAIYCLFFPLYRPVHLFILVLVSAGVYVLLSRVFPGVTELVEIPVAPVSTGDADIDALVAEGRDVVAEIRRIGSGVADAAVRAKLVSLAEITDKIFSDVLEDPSDYRQIRRFADLYLPTTMKLLRSYDSFARVGGEGDHVTGAISRIDAVLDTIIASYNRQFDALFYNQALDIETDISVLETMLKKEGLSGSDFG
jgi:hypothetical protein